MFDNARAKVRKVDRTLISIRGRLGRFEDSADVDIVIIIQEGFKDILPVNGESNVKAVEHFK